MNTKNEIKKLLEKNNLSRSEVTILNNRYILQDKIDKGGLSNVYKAIDIYNEYFGEESSIAIKIPNKKLLKKDDVAAFAYAEYKFIRKLNHPNIVRVYDFAVDKKTKTPYIVLEYIKGEKLIFQNISTMNISSKNNMFKKLYSTIRYIHKNKIIHADINPYNIIKDKENYTIFDFGVSQNQVLNEQFNLEYNKVKVFNPLYSAPEVVEKNNPTINSDIFSFACVMYEIYAKKQLFEKSSIELYDDSFNIDFSKIPFILKRWFKNALSVKEDDRNMNIKLIRFLK